MGLTDKRCTCTAGSHLAELACLSVCLIYWSPLCQSHMFHIVPPRRGVQVGCRRNEWKTHMDLSGKPSFVLVLRAHSCAHAHRIINYGWRAGGSTIPPTSRRLPKRSVDTAADFLPLRVKESKTGEDGTLLPLPVKACRLAL